MAASTKSQPSGPGEKQGQADGSSIGVSTGLDPRDRHEYVVRQLDRIKGRFLWGRKEVLKG